MIGSAVANCTIMALGVVQSEALDTSVKNRRSLLVNRESSHVPRS